ncbi:MAG TPA: ComEA family DNA-binding protein [Acidimicrobiia bacterium]|nr:ComEA family DNA-binding protein [Acidimicrobiia bacterium]
MLDPPDPLDRAHGVDAPALTPSLPVNRPPLDERGVAAVAARLDAWRGDPRAGAVLLAIVAVFAGVVWFRSGTESSAAADAARTPTGATTATVAPTTTTTTPSELVVHVAGAVARPGVVRLRPGARVVDALDAAGGAAPDADLDRLNLAAPLADGTRIAVPRIGEPAVPLDPSAPGAGADSPVGGAAPVGPLDLNAAGTTELETLPGIGPTLAAAIVEERERNGPFRSVDDLERVPGIGSGRLDALRDLVRV